MKRYFFGLLTGLLLGGAAYFVFVPNMKQASYDSGFAVGNKHGVDSGMAAGIVQGEVKLRDELKRKHEAEIDAAKVKEAAARKAEAARRLVHVAKPQQNWHVIDGKIADPIKDEPAVAKKDSKDEKKDK